MDLSKLSSTGVQFIRNHVLDRDFFKPRYSKAVWNLAVLIDNPEEYNKAALELSNGAAMGTQRI